MRVPSPTVVSGSVELRDGHELYRSGIWRENLWAVSNERLIDLAGDPSPIIVSAAAAELRYRLDLAAAPVVDPCRCPDLHTRHSAGANGCAFGPGAYRVRRYY